MTLLTLSKRSVFYPCSDGEPLAETSIHIDAIIHTVVTLRNYLEERAIVLADQYLYYADGFPRLRVAPDIMVIFDVPPGARDNYKMWEEGQIPSLVFEITSESTRTKDESEKKDLYESLDIPEYWQFDPNGEWIPEKLRGYRLDNETYQPITDGRIEPLGLRVEIDGTLLAFYREDNNEKLLAPAELLLALRRETLARVAAEERAEEERSRAEEERSRAEQAQLQAEQAQSRAEQAQSRAEKLAERLRALGEDPDDLSD
jgi:Uma2 family endonuclease